MVSSRIPSGKPFQSQLLFSPDPPNAVVTDHLELDFSDVFGPIAAEVPVELSLNVDELEDVSASEVSELIYDDPVVIYSRSHSLVGPSCISQSLKLSKLTLHETDNSLEAVVEHHEPSVYHNVAIGSLKDAENSIKSPGVGIEDFEILKVVGQGAFGKVYQVRKTGTSEIYAMKVMQKDKIIKKNHAEYMKAERDILTKIDHPFIVQLRYSFQVKSSS